MPQWHRFTLPVRVRSSAAEGFRVVRRKAPVLAPIGALALFVAFEPQMAVHRHGSPGPVAEQAVRELQDTGEVPVVIAAAAAVEPSEFAATERPVAAAPRLDREQSNIVRFVTARYGVALETAQQFVHHAYRAATEFRVDPLLVLAVVSVESSFDPRAQSGRGAQGLMQVHTRVHREKFEPFGGLAAAFDPIANLRVGTRILKDYLVREGSVEGALKSYVGAALLEHDGGYGMKVLQERQRIAAAASGRPVPVGPLPQRDVATAVRVKWSDARDEASGGRRSADLRTGDAGGEGASGAAPETVPLHLEPGDFHPGLREAGTLAPRDTLSDAHEPRMQRAADET